jgi:hypothetical protein
MERLAQLCLGALEGESEQKVRGPATVTKTSRLCSLWGGMGAVYEVSIVLASQKKEVIIVKEVRLPKDCASIGDARKKDSYDVEASFYGKGHWETLQACGASVPRLLHMETTTEGLIICMSRLEGRAMHSCSEENALAVMVWLARLHAAFWGPKSDVAVQTGLAAQGPTGIWTLGLTSTTLCPTRAGRDD